MSWYPQAPYKLCILNIPDESTKYMMSPLSTYTSFFPTFQAHRLFLAIHFSKLKHSESYWNCRQSRLNSATARYSELKEQTWAHTKRKMCWMERDGNDRAATRAWSSSAEPSFFRSQNLSMKSYVALNTIGDCCSEAGLILTVSYYSKLRWQP